MMKRGLIVLLSAWLGLPLSASVSRAADPDVAERPTPTQAEGTAASPGNSRSESAAVIVIPNCQIKPVQRGLLAVSRSGVLGRVDVRVGDAVRQGDMIASLDDRVAVVTLELATLRTTNDVDIRFAQTYTEIARADYDAFLRLQDRKATSDDQVRQRKLEFERGKLRSEQYEHDREILALEANRAKRDLETYHIRAPYDGRVMRILKSVGEGVHEGEAVVELVNTDRVYVEGYGRIEDLWNLPLDTYVDVRLDDARIQHSEAKQTFASQLLLIDSAVQPVTGLVRIVVEVTGNRDNILREGLKAAIQIDTGRPPTSDAESPPMP